MAEKRRRRRRPTLPFISQASFLAASLGAICIYAFVVLMALASQVEGDLPRYQVAAGAASLLVSVVCFGMGIRGFFNTQFGKPGRLIGLLVPLAAVVLWGGLYVLGWLR